MKLLAAGLAALYVALAVLSARSAPLGFFGDDAVYVETAQALAQGRGYRHVSIPGEPLQTKYPPLYPALLSLGLRLEPDPLRGFARLLLPGALAAAGAVALAAAYWRRVLGISSRASLALALLAGFSPAVLAFTRFTMSELVYALLASAALFCLDARAPRAGGRASTPWLVLGAALAGATVLTRSIGVSLALAAVAAPLLQRRFGDAAIVAAVLLACLAPWWSWQASAALANGASATSLLVAHEVGYASWLPDSPLEALRVAGQNLLRLSFGLGWFQLALPADLVRAAIAQGGLRLVLLHAVCHATLLCALWGLVASARGGLRTLHLYAAFYGAMILVWTFSPYRFLVPWTAFLIFFAATGLRSLLAAVSARLAAPAARGVRALGPAAYAVVFAFFLAEAWELARSSERDFHAREIRIDWAELRDVERFVREHTLANEVIASAHPERIFLTTGRRGHYFWPETDPVAFDYDPARDASRFTMLPVASELHARREDMERNLPRVWREAGIAWYVEWKTLDSTHGLAGLLRAHPDWFEPRYTTPLRSFAIYRVRIPAGAAR